MRKNPFVFNYLGSLSLATPCQNSPALSRQPILTATQVGCTCAAVRSAMVWYPVVQRESVCSGQ